MDLAFFMPVLLDATLISKNGPHLATGISSFLHLCKIFTLRKRSFVIKDHLYLHLYLTLVTFIEWLFKLGFESAKSIYNFKILFRNSLIQNFKK